MVQGGPHPKGNLHNAASVKSKLTLMLKVFQTLHSARKEELQQHTMNGNFDLTYD